DTIQRAAEAHQSAVLDRVWLPWQHVRRPKDGKASVLQPEDRLFERQPGTMLFRVPQPAGGGLKYPELLVVFLVGETPTAGVHKNALAASLDFIRAAKDRAVEAGETPGAAPAGQRFRILGPCFSGADTSLELALKAWARADADRGGAGRVFEVITGTATTVDKQRFEG